MSRTSGSVGSSCLSITLGHPAAAFLYQATKPRLTVDGAGVPVRGWGTRQVPVAAGTHRVEVWVPYVFPRKAGRARADVMVAEGESLALEYMAPTVTFARGSLGVPGQQRSTGYSAVMTLNVVAVAVVLVALMAFALLR